MHTYIHTYIQYIYLHIQTYMHTHIYIYIHMYVYTYIYIYIHIHSYTYIHTHTYIYIFIYTYIHTYIHTQSCYLLYRSRVDVDFFQARLISAVSPVHSQETCWVPKIDRTGNGYRGMVWYTVDLTCEHVCYYYTVAQVSRAASDRKPRGGRRSVWQRADHVGQVEP